jgi:uncharacterized protein with FMN-binding domain
MEDIESNSNKKAVITFIAMAIVAIIVVTAILTAPKKISATTTADTKSSSAATAAAASAKYKDGTYTASGNYTSPGGAEKIGVMVTLAGNKITSATVTSEAGDAEASLYQSQFISGIKPLIIGKNIATVHVSRVSGSSLTSQGFNDAIQQIENQAKA